MNLKTIFLQKRFLLLLLFSILFYAGCAHQPLPEAYDPPGFFYELGFFIGAAAFLVGAGSSA